MATQGIQYIQELKEKENKIEQAIQITKQRALQANTEVARLAEIETLEQLVRQKRVTRSEYDILYFTYEYFSEDRNPDNDDNLIPAGVSIEDAPAFHHELTQKLQEMAIVKPTKKICWSVPRGHAKSMYMSNIFPLYEILFQHRKYILIISETESMAQNFVKYVGDQLKFNEKLRNDFGVILHPNHKMNPSDNLEAFVTHTGIKVQAASMGKQIRGARHGSNRPDLVILDDLESGQNTNTRELREKNLHWYNSVVEPVGTPERTGFVYMGTLVNGQGLLSDILRRPEYDSKIYSAVVSEPDHPEMWDKYEETLRNLDNNNRLEEATQFYEDNKEMMDSGVQTLWQERIDYRYLINKKVELGSRAFASEYLNRASDKDSAIFDSDKFVYFTDADLFDEQGNPLKLEYYGFWDIAIGKNSRSDYNAIVTLARDRRTGVIYVMDAWAKKVPLHKASDEAYQKILDTKYRLFGVEAVQAQYESYRQLQQRLYKDGIYGTRIKPVVPRGKKETRIEILEPLIEAGIIRFKKEQRLLIEMMEQFPNHDHDDLPDALASAVDLMGTRVGRTHHRKPVGI